MSGTPVPVQNSQAPTAPPPVVLKPFTRSANDHTEPFGDQSVALGATSQLLRTLDVPAFGFLRHLIVEVTATGGAGGGAVALADAPFSVLGEIKLTDVNGRNIVGPVDGFEAYLANKWGGYSNRPDPKDDPGYSAPSVNGNFSYRFRIPVQLSERDGLGALANTNASSTYKLSMTVQPSTSVFSTAPATLPTIRVRVWLDAWSAVAGQDWTGAAQAIQPPAHGTTQMWSREVFTVSAGEVRNRVTRVGNLVRMHVLIGRTAAGVRSDTVLPDPFRLERDSLPYYNESLAVRRWQMFERLGPTAQTLDAGVLVLDWAHDLDGQIGEEGRDMYLPTLQSTRLDYSGTIAAAGTWTLLTNDIAPVGNIYID